MAHAQTDKDEAAYRAAGRLLERGDAKGAEEEFNALLERFPENAPIRYARAVARSQLGKSQEAMDDLDVAISVDPQMADAYILRAEARLQLDNYDGALADANQAVRLTKNAEWRALMTRAQAQHAYGHVTEALADYTAVLALDADNANARFARADIQINLGENEQAHADLTRLLEYHADNPKIHFRLAAAEFGRNHWEATRQSLAKAIELGTPAIDTARLWGMSLFAQGDFDGAIAKLSAADPRDAYAQLMLHLAQRRSGKEATALKAALPTIENEWTKLVGQYLLGEVKEDALLETAEGKADPKEKRGCTCEAYYYIGQIRLLAGDKIAAKALFQQAVATGAKEYNEYTLAEGELARAQ